MKNFRKITAMLLVALSISFVGCNDDDDDSGPIVPGTPTGTDIRYEVATSADIITKVRYKKGNGEYAFGHSDPDSVTSWFMTIIVGFEVQPYLVETEVTMKNDTGENQSYTFEIYEDGNLVETESGVLAPENLEVVRNITYTVNNTP